MSKFETKKSRVVYTAIFGAYDRLAGPNFVSAGDTDYVCFTDRKDLRSDFWKIVRLNDSCFPRANLVFETDRKGNLPRPKLTMLQNREVKFFPDTFISGPEMTAYMDGHLRLRRCLSTLMETSLLNSEWSSPRHRYGGNYLLEALRCFDQSRISRKELLDFFEKNTSVSVRRDAPMPENGLIIRRHNNQKVSQMCANWWDLFSQGPFRDQLHWQQAYSVSDIRFSYLPHRFSEPNEFYYLARHRRKIFELLLVKYKFYTRKSFLKA